MSSMKENERDYTAEEIINMDLEGIYIGNLNTVEADLSLPEEGKYGSRFQWTTGEERFIAEDGTVHRPLSGMGNRNVTLRVRALYGACSGEREFIATVLQEKKETKVAETVRVRVSAMPGEKAALPPVVIAGCEDGRRITLPVKWEDYKPLYGEGTVCVQGHPDGCAQEALAEISYRKEGKKENTSKRKTDYFPIHKVRLLDGTLYYKRQQDMLQYLLHVDNGQMLYNFRRAAGLGTQGAEPMTGWDGEDSKLRGHTTGHYLSGLALAWGDTGDERFLRKLDDMVDGLAECQKAMAESGKYHRGFLSAYPEEQFDLLETFTPYPDIWAPYYTLDKIMSGLYDCWDIAGNQRAGEMLSLMGDWVYERLARLPKETLDRMWSMYIAGESGAMQGTMVKVYRITGKDTHLEAARLFSNEKLFYPMEQNADTLEDLHANQHIPQIMGAMELYGVLREARYFTIGRHFWEIVTGGHIYCNGGTGETEMFHRAGTVCDYLTDKSEESCASYNMLRLTAQLFLYTADGGLMDYYDNTLRNHILASCSHTDDGGTTYFLPLAPGGSKEYSTTENSCCHGTGMESRFRYMEHIYACDGESVYVNLLIDSVLSESPHIEIHSEQEGGKVRILCGEDMGKKLKIHIPSWAKEKFFLSVNDRELPGLTLREGYVCLPENIRAGDEVVLKLPMELRILECKTDQRYVNLAYGPYILAALSEEKKTLALPPLSEIIPGEKPLRFKAGNVTLLPLAEVDQEAYQVYFMRLGTGYFSPQ